MVHFTFFSYINGNYFVLLTVDVVHCLNRRDYCNLVFNRRTAEKHTNIDFSSYAYLNRYINFKYTECYAEKENGPITWLKIVFFSFVLFPVGLYFMYRKIHFEKLKYYYNGMNTLIYGTTVFLLFGSFSILIGLSAQTPPFILFIPSLLFTLLGLTEMIIGFVVKEIGKTNDKIIKTLFVDKITDIDEIAKIFKSNYFKTCKKIQGLIDSDILNNIYIHHKEREIIINGISNKIALKCKNCAGTTVLQENDERICCYCGAKI